ncbi:M48 family metallopeptidase [Longimicrobium sp.]|uniref:M48 family metallopeptidase n=1 Tax=Longimicrobium sp. TaxID=2029185 RepID=UPI002C853909|nr:M48 family metallopeptidase [Longimicrobium sp.]HSU16453.1 M48 family metallopeptidase [Longimicrobium sp.]
MLRTLLLALALTLAPALAPAQAPAPPADTAHAAAAGLPAPNPPPVAASAAAPSPADTGAVPVPPASEKALRYERSGNVLWVIGTLWSLLIPALILFTGLSARIRDLSRRPGRKWYFTLAIYGALITLLLFVVNLPLAFYEEFVREHAYGLSNQTFAKWATDALTNLVIGIVGVALVMWVPYLLLRKSPRRWWLWTALAGIPLIVVTVWLQPLLIEPMFNRFGPMHDRALEQRILAEAERAGIEGGRVYEVNKSVDTKAVNAYVTGFGGSKRIVLWDTILRKLDARELLFVMGHEMGHYVLKHIAILLSMFVALLLACLWLVHASSGWLIRRHGRRFGFDRLDDIASYPLLALIVGVVGFAITPIPLAVSRHLEHEADRFGLELTRDNHAAATAFAKLQEENLATPYHGTLYKLWHDNHPPLGERIEFCNTYKPWAHGQPLRYGGHFKDPAPAR